MIDSTYSIKIPNNRIGVIIGKNGKVKQAIENLSLCKLDINSETGDVNVFPRPELKDPVRLIKTNNIIKAIARGFSPQQALNLFNDDFYLEIVYLRDFVGSSKKQIARIKSRLIGSEGKTRKLIEKATKTVIVISGGTVAIIGTYIHLIDAKEAISRLIGGADHGSVFAFLKERQQELEQAEDDLWKMPDIENMSTEELQAMLLENKKEENLDLDAEFDKLIEEDN